MKKPIIAVTPTKRYVAGYPGDLGWAHGSVYWNQDLITEYGGIPVIPDFVDEENALALMEVCDGLFLTGGADVDPSEYGEKKEEFCAETQPYRDASDLNLMKAAMKLGKPVLAICRGCQIANVYFGGTLYQDLPIQTGTTINHSNYEVSSFVGFVAEDCAHPVTVEKDSPLYKLVGREVLYTNSLHHQAVKDIGKGCVVQAKAPDGVVESWYLDSETQYVRAYQWHPEFMNKHDAKDAIIEDFLKACGK